MAPKFRRARAGSADPPSAGAWNDMLSMLEAYQGGGLESIGNPLRSARDVATCRIKNTTEADVPLFGVLGIDSGFVINPSDNVNGWQATPVLKGIEPAIEDHRSRFVVTLQPIKAGRIGFAVVSGLVPCLLNSTSATQNARFARVKDAETGYLELSYAGLYPVKAVESGTGSKWGLVMIGGSPTRIVPAATAAAISEGASGSVTLKTGEKGSETNTTETLTQVLNRFGDLESGSTCDVQVDEYGAEIIAASPC